MPYIARPRHAVSLGLVCSVFACVIVSYVVTQSLAESQSRSDCDIMSLCLCRSLCERSLDVQHVPCAWSGGFLHFLVH